MLSCVVYINEVVRPLIALFVYSLFKGRRVEKVKKLLVRGGKAVSRDDAITFFLNAYDYD